MIETEHGSLMGHIRVTEGLESWHCFLLFLFLCADTACVPPEATSNRWHAGV